ncbi:CHAP domain-containing protein [Rhizobium leguminosarum]|uniref:CHAP domain-containing protein n=1 Tax=Rhizobium leguminosarum TaxID=384 RepID=UPI0010319CEF|nr:CHAP domain-containing protein [Rhizobium leguminosarum]TAV74742.1 CHAP domain-containing protein [Rhizobium leguminosarum]TAV79341.1 CHAP domain-containing protein [Rhizobium leguminosarum]
MINLQRRMVLGGAAAWAISYGLGHATDDDGSDLDAALNEAINSNSSLTLGRIIPPPTDISWVETRRILSRAPRGTTPYEVASYFVEAVPPEYQMAWPEPNPAHPTFANPVILSFFLKTHTTPAGDTTPWCAAFMNWCLWRSGCPQTGKANAVSFLKWGKPVWKLADGGMPVGAKTGDVAVFRNQRNPAHGHVAFFVEISKKVDKRIDVLGGNQISRINKQKLHLIQQKTMRVDGDLQLVAIRTMDGLRTG